MAEDNLPRKTIRVMQTIAAASESGIGLSEVARQSDIPKATCYRILSVLEQERWIALHPDTRRYRVSIGVLSIAARFLGAGDFSGVQETLTELSAESGETSGFDMFDGATVKVLAQQAGNHLIGQTPRPVPRDQPIWTTASGKAMLSCLTHDEIVSRFGGDFLRTVDDSPARLDAFIDALAAVRERGYSTAIDELEPGAAAVGAPIVMPDGLIYGVWLGGPTFRFTTQRLPEFGALVVQAAGQLRRLLGR